MDMMQPPQPQEASQGDQMMEAPEAEAFTVCIEVVGDGTFMVGLKSDDAPPAAGPAGPMGAGPMGAAPEGAPPDASMKPARDVKEALTIALSIIKAGGKQEQAAGDFQAGYDEMGTR